MRTADRLSRTVPDLDLDHPEVRPGLFDQFPVRLIQVFFGYPFIRRKTVVALMLIHQFSPVLRLYTVPCTVIEALEISPGTPVRPQVKRIGHTIDYGNRSDMVYVDVKDVSPVQGLPAVFVPDNGMYLAGVESRTFEGFGHGIVKVPACRRLTVAIPEGSVNTTDQGRIGSDPPAVQLFRNLGGNIARLFKFTGRRCRLQLFAEFLPVRGRRHPVLQALRIYRLISMIFSDIGRQGALPARVPRCENEEHRRDQCQHNIIHEFSRAVPAVVPFLHGPSPEYYFCNSIGLRRDR